MSIPHGIKEFLTTDHTDKGKAIEARVCEVPFLCRASVWPVVNNKRVTQGGELREIDLLKRFGNELHFPHVRKMEGETYDSLWELRVEFASDTFRIFYFMYYQNRSVLLHGFQKKTEKTPPKELDIALNRMKNYLERKKRELG